MSFFPDDEPAARPPRLKSATPPWLAPPTNELAVPVPIFAVLARSPGVALCLRRVDVFREGWRFAFSARAVRAESMSDDEWFDVLERVQSRGPMRRHQDSGGLRIGIELSDGSRVFGNDHGRPGVRNGVAPEVPQLLLRHGSGGGSDDEYDSGLHGWLWPSPLLGSFRLVYDWRALGIPEQSLAVDSPELVTARANVLDIWGA